MSTNDLDLTGDPEPLVDSFARAKEELASGGAHHHGPIETVRESTYCGHRIVVRTTYEITVDDKPIEGHLGVTNDGHVHYHPIPNLGFASAIELVEKIIDTFPDDFDAPADVGGGTEPDDDGPHEGEPHEGEPHEGEPHEGEPHEGEPHDHGPEGHDHGAH